MTIVTREPRAVPAALHAVAAAFIASCLWLARARPALYESAMQEDRAIEWATVCLFLAAGVVRLRHAIATRRVFDGLVALFCLVFAGEEMSWGQRLLGVTPPAYFLEHNTQQELNVHNFGGVFGSPKWPLIAVLTGYAVLLPLVTRIPAGRRVLERIGASSPPSAAIPWYLIAIALLVRYPVRFTGEWVEALTGATFLASAVSSRVFLSLLPLSAALSALLTLWSSRGSASTAQLECARREATSLAHVVADAMDLTGRNVHKRVWTLVEEGDLAGDDVMAALDSVRCEPDNGSRRAYAVDPWGTAYWLRTRTGRDSVSGAVYSFGPNRRRDDAGDDIVSSFRR